MGTVQDLEAAGMGIPITFTPSIWPVQEKDEFGE